MKEAISGWSSAYSLYASCGLELVQWLTVRDEKRRCDLIRSSGVEQVDRAEMYGRSM